jgi:branched-chain amino acid transport system ATP-binding protein
MLLLDEPSLGLAPVLVTSIFANLAQNNREGVTILLVEPNVLRALGWSQPAYVLENGRIAGEGRGSASWPTRGSSGPISAAEPVIR